MTDVKFIDIGGFVFDFLIEAVTRLDGDENAGQTLSKIIDNRTLRTGSPTGAIFQVDFRVEGVELPFVEVMKDIEMQLDRLISAKAEQLLDERLCPHFDALDKLKKLVTEKLQQDLGIATQ